MSNQNNFFAGIVALSNNTSVSMDTKVFKPYTHYLTSEENAAVINIKETKDGAKYKYVVTAVLAVPVTKDGKNVVDENGEVVMKTTFHKIMTNKLVSGLACGDYLKYNKERKKYDVCTSSGKILYVRVVSCDRKFIGKEWAGDTIEKEYTDKDGNKYSRIINMRAETMYSNSVCVFGIGG